MKNFGLNDPKLLYFNSVTNNEKMTIHLNQEYLMDCITDLNGITGEEIIE